MSVFSDRASALFSGQLAASASPAIDTRACKNYGYLYYSGGKAGTGTGASAILTLQGSHDGATWLNVEQWTAVPPDVWTAQIVGYYPYMRASAGPCYTASGAAGTGTGVYYVYYAPGLG